MTSPDRWHMAMMAGVASRSWRAAVLALVTLLLLGTAATRPVAAHGPDAGLPEPPLRLSEKVEVVVADAARSRAGRRS